MCKFIVCVLISFFRAHFDLEFLFKCKEHNIMFIPLPKNATHILQPLDVGFFSEFKREWSRVVQERMKRFPDERSLDNSVVCGLVSATINKMGSVDVAEFLMKGYRLSGLYPIVPDIVLRGMFVWLFLCAFERDWLNCFH
jgi:hypothetical protein